MDNNPLNEMILEGGPFYEASLKTLQRCLYLFAPFGIIGASEDEIRLAKSLVERQIQILENDGTAGFSGLYKGRLRVKARQTYMPNDLGGQTLMWEVWTSRFPHYFPVGKLAAQAALGMVELMEFAPARAAIVNGKVGVVRTGDPWGSDAKCASALAPENPYPRVVKSYG